MIRVHPKGVLALLGVVAAFALALQVRLEIVAVVMASIVDWSYLSAPFLRAGRESKHS
jgi:hypothetical protein